MTYLTSAEIVSAIFVAIIFALQMTTKADSKSSKLLRINMALVFMWLIADATTYLTNLSYIPTLITYSMSGIVMLSFILYCGAFIREKTKISPWIMRIPALLCIVIIAEFVISFICNQLVVYENGVPTAVNSLPAYISVIQIIVVLYTLIVLFVKIRNIGVKQVVLSALFFSAPYITIILFEILGEDYSVVASAVSLVVFTLFIQQDSLAVNMKKALETAKSESQRNTLVYEIAGASNWSYEISADDKVTAAFYGLKAKSEVMKDRGSDPMEWVKIIHPEDRERTLAQFMSAIYDHTGKTPYEVSYRVLFSDGSYHWAKSSGRVIRHSDGTAELFGMSVDITAQMDKELKQQEQLEKALRMAEVANRAKTDFLFNMSHDIRTPMNAIIGFTNIAKKEIDNREKALDSLNKVQLSSDILLSLINDVLDMSRIESGMVMLHEEKYEITEAFDSFEPAMASLAASKDINLQFSIGNVRDRYIFADGPRFDRILINIISNAIKYTPAEGFVKVSAEQIEDTEPGFGNYKFTVADSGIGMSEEFQKHMFENFSREENTTTRNVQGTGLGLALAKKLTELMGGMISCKSTQGIGTTFTMIFPFRLQTEEDMAEVAAEEKEITAINLEGKKALLVEDNELNREIAGEILSDEGIIVETASDGQKAVNKVRERGADYYDFILMDIQMPVMNGYEATQTIRKLIPELRAPIIALSANAFAEDRKKSIDAGMDDHVAKPINIKDLNSTLAKFL